MSRYDTVKQQMEGKWDQLKGKVRETWGALTDQDLEEIKGNWERLVGKVKEKTGEAREAIEEKLERIFDGERPG